MWNPNLTSCLASGKKKMSCSSCKLCICLFWLIFTWHKTWYLLATGVYFGSHRGLVAISK